MNSLKLLLAVAIAGLIVTFFVLDLDQYLSLAYFKSQQVAISDHFHNHPIETLLLFFVLYVAVTSLSLPGAALLTLVAGALFGVLWGTLVVSFASTLGATLAFLSARFLLRDWVQGRFGTNLKTINDGIARDGAFYLFTLRLVPAFPFFVINLVMGLTPLRTATFAWVSQVGMLAGTLVYVNAGTQLAGLDSVSGILSPGLLVAFTLLGLFPLLAKWLVATLKSYAMLSRYPRPRWFQYNLVVIGAGSGGLVSAYLAAAVKAKVALIEQHRMGGDCLNTGCVPSKTLLRSARLLAQVRRAPEFGCKLVPIEFDFAEVMERVQRVIRTVAPHDSVERYTGLGVNCIMGTARITTPYTVEVNGLTLTTRNIVIATGARPFVPPIPGLAEVGYLTSDNIWELRELPPRLVVLGGGPIGCELAQAFARFGSEVTQVEKRPRLLSREDAEIAELVARRLQAEGVRVWTDHQLREFRLVDGRKWLIGEQAGREVKLEFDQVLVAVGRVANTQGYGLEELGIRLTPSGTIEVNEYLQTVYPNIYAVGDVAGPYQFTHTAAHQAWFATVNSLFGRFRKFKVDYSVIPWATFTDPEVARVGLNEQEAQAQGIPYEVSLYPLDDLDRAIAEEEAHGLVKVLTVPGKDRILGVTIVGTQAGDIITEYVTAMRHGLGLNKILGTIHIYPTLAEANKYAAGVWKRAHAPAGLLRWVERYHRWLRGKPSGRLAEMIAAANRDGGRP